jgi:hypothetical protein
MAKKMKSSVWLRIDYPNITQRRLVHAEHMNEIETRPE